MAATAKEIKSEIIDLSAEAFEAFCEDVGGMFGVDMECSQQEACTTNVKELKRKFKKPVGINFIKAEGTLSGNFQIVFDKGGFFTMAGVIVMLPEQKILENIKTSSAEATEKMTDSFNEAGNLLVGSWDRIFREYLEGHEHFLQSSTFIGDPWSEPEEKIGLGGEEEFLFVPHQMTIGSYPTFNCGVIFPKNILSNESTTDGEASDAAEEKSKEVAETVEDTAKKSDSKEADSKKPDAAGENDGVETESQPAANEEAVESKAPEQPVEIAKDTAEKNQIEAQEPTTKEAADDKAELQETPEPKEVVDEAKTETGPVSQSIQKMAQSAAHLPGGTGQVNFGICAKDVMQKEILWGNAGDSVQDCITKMQQSETGYMLVGTEGQLQGIVSKFDIAGAVSINLRPLFAKWRQPMDEATLQIRIKWIMSRPVHTIPPETSLVRIMDSICRFGSRALPVVDQQGKVQGLVTVFDVLRAILNSSTDVSVVGKTLDTPPLT